MKKNKKYYAVGVLEKSVDLTILCITRSIPLIWSDNQIGAIPVFKYKKDAKNYIKAGGNPNITIIEIEEKGLV